MRLVLDASVVLPFVAQTNDQGDALRSWLIEQLDGSAGHVIHTLTQVEVLGALRQLEAVDEIDPTWAMHVQRRFASWPFTTELVNAQSRERVWELRERFSISDACYIAAAESLQAELLEEVALCTADAMLIESTLPCTVLPVPTFPSN